MEDLLVLYPAEKASPRTRALVEGYAEKNKEFAVLLRSAGAVPPSAPRGRDAAMQTLAETRKYLKLQKMLFGMGLFLCLLPFTVLVQHSKLVFFLLRDAPVMASCSMALGVVAWAWYWVAGRQLRKAGL